jgi:Tfp pilus assembly protein PilX
MSNNTKLLCLFLKAQKTDKSSEQGYAMALVSLMTIILLSLLAGAYVFSNLARSRTDAFVDSNSSFAVAESGLHKRANEFKTKLANSYSGVSGIVTSTEDKGLGDCFGVGISTVATATATDDFECRNYSFKTSNTTSHIYENNSISVNAGKNADGTDRSPSTYIAYTRVSAKSVQPISIPTGDPFEGLNASEYKYVLYSTAKKPTGLNADGTMLAGGDLPVYTTEEIAAKNRNLQNQTAFTGDDVLIASYNTKKTAAASTTAFTSASTAAGGSSNNISLSMTFANRVIPLFQFGIFYNGDLEFNSTSAMQVDGRVHSNANIYAQPAGVNGVTGIDSTTDSVTTFKKKVSAAGKIYNRVDAWAPGIGRTGIVRVLVTGNVCDTEANCPSFPAYASTVTTALNTSAFITNPFGNLATPPAQTAQDLAIAARVQDGAAGAIELKTPSPGFTRKRNYFNNRIGEYYAKADMRLDFVPDRDVTSKTTAPWTRDEKIIPFNFTAITSTGTGTCTTTAPTAGTDPAANYIDSSRDSASTRHCNQFTKGQLQSLRQPVLVLRTLPYTALQTIENTTLGIPNPLPTAPVLAATVTPAQKNQILRALQVAVAATPSPIRIDELNFTLDNPIYGDSDASDNAICNTGCIPNANNFKITFKRLIKTIFPVSAAANTATDLLNIASKNTLLAASPNQIAAIQGAWFLPAPIQRVETTTFPDAANTTNPTTLLPTPNPRSSGFYDGREKRWISVLQTNIASLSVWNRDGLYVNADNETMTSAYTANLTKRDLAFNSGTGANFTDGKAFDRSAADSTKPSGSFQYLGLGSNDTTEGGLVVHASVNDDLNGDGVMDANDITTDTTNPILKKNPDNTNYIDPTTGTTVTIDYLRKYPGDTATTIRPVITKISPFAFAFNGGNYLPNGLMLSSDQSVYVQGNFNNNTYSDVCRDATATTVTNRPNCQENSAPNTPSPDRLAAAIVADTITALSNQCINIANPLGGVPAGQLNCGLKASYNPVTSPMAINAAFLSNTEVSNNNQGRSPVSEQRFSGGVNNYIRLLEDWANLYALNYTGSMVSLGSPLEYSGAYKSGGLPGYVNDLTAYSYYNIPFRNINYDTRFDVVAQMPPLTPKASYVQQKNFGRTY